MRPLVVPAPHPEAAIPSPPALRARPVTPCATAVVGMALAFVAAVSHAEKWPSVPAEHLGLAQPTVDRQADAEAIFWEVRVEDELAGDGYTTVLWHHIRIKVFTERGRESQSRVDLVYERHQQIGEISARSISPAGKVAELAANEVYSRTLVKANRVRVQARTFVIPGVEVGSIVEYRWREFRGTRFRQWGVFELQRDIPIQRLTYRVKPISFRNAPPLQQRAFNAVLSDFEYDGFGHYISSTTRVPAFIEEPDMPPEREVRRWMVMYYALAEHDDQAERWRTVARGLAQNDDDLRRAGRDLRKAALEIAGDAPDPEERLRRIHAFCRTRIRDLERKDSGLTEEERGRLEPNKHPKSTLDSGKGTRGDINRLFAALASGAGFDVRRAQLGDREYIYFRKELFAGFLTAGAVAVRVGESWRFFDPASAHVPFGMLRWQEEGGLALVQEKGEPVWLTTPLTSASRSVITRTGSFRLAEDGTLEGEVRLAYSGHVEIEERGRLEESSVEERERVLRERLKARMPAADLADVRFEHVTSAESSLVLSYRLRAPGYAQVTGKRLFFPPAVFQHGGAARFETSTRRNAIDLQYPWSEQDSLVIELPVGYQLDHPDAPSEFELPGVYLHRVKLGTTHEGSRVVYRRQMSFDRYFFEQRLYPGVKAAFEAIHDSDQHTLALRQTAGSGP